MLSTARPPPTAARRDTPGGHVPRELLHRRRRADNRVVHHRIVRRTCGDAVAHGRGARRRDTPGRRPLKGRFRFVPLATDTPFATDATEPRQEPERP
jgi:hypothetical protein